MQNILDLNPDVLDNVASVIENYIKQQNGLIEDYLSKMVNLQKEWNDDETIGKVLIEIRMIVNVMEEIESEILKIYPKFFREKAQEIRVRPTI